MRSLLTFAIALFGFSAANLALGAPHQEGGYGYGDGYGQTFRCESDGNRTRQCRVDTRGGVVLVRQLSSTRCVEGRNWGYDRGGVWVSQGCRGEFRSGGGGYGSPGWGNAQMLRCESDNGRYRTCAIPRNGQVRLIRQLSSTRCVEGRNWGRQRGAIWVSRGCRGEFQISGRGNQWGGGGWDDGWHGDGGGQLFRCESDSGRTRYCQVDGRRVTLQRQLSSSPCIEGRTWGTDRYGVWVSHGCRGEFRAW
ncbi:DUF3011 domain-containing protein [Pseudoxanthomonas wuyuanensis]